MTNYNDFIDRYYSTAPRTSKRGLENFLNRFDELVDGRSPKECLQNIDFVSKLFFVQSVSNMSRACYFQNKKHILNLCDWYGAEPTIPTMDELMEQTLLPSLFKDLHDALNYIDAVGNAVLMQYHPHTDLIVVKAIFVLAWYGLSLEEIANLQKTAVEVINPDSGILRLENRAIEITGEAFFVLFSLKYLNQYQGISSGKLQQFYGFESYMFRPTCESTHPVNVTNITQRLTRFNEQIPSRFNKRISYRSIRRNAHFVQIHEDDRDIPLVEKIQDITGAERHVAYSYRRQYIAWVNAFYNEL